MSPITILHVSDLHWDKSKANDQRIVIDALLEDLRRLRGDGLKPDLVLFTGDLVQAGDDPASFASVADHFLRRLRKETEDAPLIVAPGNHDIQRSVVQAAGGYVEAGLKSSLQSVDSLNRFIDAVHSGTGGTGSALERLTNYETAYCEMGCPPPLFQNSLLKVYKLLAVDKKVGIAVFNTAWRATGGPDNVDRHELLLGERNVDIAIDQIRDCDLRIAAFHHPLDWLADFDNVAVSSRFYAEFDLIAYGHTHLGYPEARVTPIGSAIISQAGCLYEHRDYFNGYQFVTFDCEAGLVHFEIRSYFNRPRRCFDRALNIANDGHLTFNYSGRQSSSNGELERFLRQVRPIIRQVAADQVNIVDAVNDLKLDPKEAFVCPPLTMHRSSSVDATNSQSDEDELEAEQLLLTTDNYLMVGPRESGKSTLAHYLAVLASEGAIDRTRIPVVTDFRQLKLTKYGLSRAIATYLGAAREGIDIESHLKSGDFIVFVDNFSGREGASRDSMAALVAEFSNCRWVLMSDARLVGAYVQENDSDLLNGFKAVHIQHLPRKSIRVLSSRWCDPIGIDGHKAFAAIMVQLREANLPRTGYMVTLLLWALYNERKFDRVNEALLLTYVIDHLLGKADFAQLQQPFDPVSKEITLQHLATKLRESGGIIQKNDILEILIVFFKGKGLQYDASEVLRQLVNCGLLKDDFGIVSFKYRCFEEYFYANYLRNDSKALLYALSDRRFLDYSRELELLSGLRRKNGDILDVLRAEIQSGMPADLHKFEPQLFDEIAVEESGVGVNRRRLEDIRKRTLTADQIDDLMDAAEREAVVRDRRQREAERNATTNEKAAIEPDQVVEPKAEEPLGMPMRPIEFMASVDLLGKVVRSSEFSELEDKVAATRLHLRSSAQVMLLFFDIFRQVLEEYEKKGASHGEARGEEVRATQYVIRKWFLIATSVMMFDQIGADNLFKVYESILDDESTTFLERILLSMLLLDLGHSRWLAIWAKLIESASGNRFILDTLMDRLWHVTNTRVLPEAERKRLEAAAARIEEAFGIPKRERVTAAAIEKTAKEAARRDENRGGE